MNFSVKGFKKAASVGVFGSLWLIFASVLGIIERQGSLADGTLVINIIFLALVSAGLTYLAVLLRKEWFLMLVPALAWVLKESLKQLVNLGYFYNFELFGTAVLFAVPVGGLLYFLIYIKGTVRVWE